MNFIKRLLYKQTSKNSSSSSGSGSSNARIIILQDPNLVRCILEYCTLSELLLSGYDTVCRVWNKVVNSPELYKDCMLHFHLFHMFKNHKSECGYPVFRWHLSQPGGDHPHTLFAINKLVADDSLDTLSASFFRRFSLVQNILIGSRVGFRRGYLIARRFMVRPAYHRLLIEFTSIDQLLDMDVHDMVLPASIKFVFQATARDNLVGPFELKKSPPRHIDVIISYLNRVNDVVMQVTDASDLFLLHRLGVLVTCTSLDLHRVDTSVLPCGVCVGPRVLQVTLDPSTILDYELQTKLYTWFPMLLAIVGDKRTEFWSSFSTTLIGNIDLFIV